MMHHPVFLSDTTGVIKCSDVFEIIQILVRTGCTAIDCNDVVEVLFDPPTGTS